MQRANDDGDKESADLFDHAQLRNYGVFVAGSLRRHRRLAAAVLVSIIGLTITALAILPRTYHVEAKLLAQRSQVLAIRGDSPDATVAPTRGAVETVQRRDNLVAIIASTDLVRHYQDHRAIAGRMLDAVRRVTGPEASEQDRIDGMVELLEKRLTVWTTDGTVSIAIDWPDAQMAARLVDTAQQNFLETRRDQEITALVESIAILRGHAPGLRADVDDAVAALAKLREGREPAEDVGPAKLVPGVRGSAARSHAAPRSATPRAAEPDPALALLKVAIDAKQRAIDDLEEARRRRLTETQARLVEQRATLTGNHPDVLALQQTVSVLSGPSPQVGALKKELAALEADYASKRAEPRETAPASGGTFVASARTVTAAAAAPPPLPTEIVRLDEGLREDRDPITVYARAQLRDAMEKYSALRAQVHAAQIDLETAQAAFKYRYSVLTPAQIPKQPLKPNVPLVLALALLAGLVLAVVVSTVADVRAGRLVERWQIEALVGQPILGELDVPRLPGRDPE